MELSVDRQLFDQIKKSTAVIIALPDQLDVDAVASAIGLRSFLTKSGKRAVIASSGTLPDVAWNFLGAASGAASGAPPQVVSSLQSSDGLVVVLDTATRDLDELSYRRVGNKLEILLKAKDGVFTPEDVTVIPQPPKFDLVITLGVSSLDDLGRLYQDSPELFSTLPKINIDIRSANEYFGAVNLVDVTASSLGELLAGLLKGEAAVGSSAPVDVGAPDLIDADIATAFLAGIISRTHSFQQPQTTPQTLSAAAALIERGARQQEIIVSLFKTKDFALLKLWGRALARLKTVEAHSFLFTVLSAADFQRTETGPDMLVPVLREFIDNVSGFQILAIIAEVGDGALRVTIAAPPHISLSDLAARMGGETVSGGPLPLRGVYRYLAVDLPNTNLGQAETLLLEAVAHIKAN